MPYPRPQGSQLVKPAALSPECQQSIIELLSRGNYLSTACEASGITYNGFRWWQVRWEQGDKDAQKYDDFFKAIKRASAIAEVDALDVVRNGNPAWQGNGWFLERRFPKRWGRKDRKPDPPKPQKPLSDMTPDELDEYEKRLES